MPLIVPLMILVFTLFISGISAEKLFAMGSNGALLQPQEDKKDKGQSEEKLDDRENREAQPLEKERDDSKAEKSSSKKKKSHLKYMEEGS